MSGVERVRIDTEKNFLDVLDKVHDIKDESIDPTHVFPLSQVYEGLLLKMGEKGNDGGQFFTPREIIRAMVRTIDPRIGDTVYDPCCGTGGFLVEAYQHIRREAGDAITAEELAALKHETLFGREKENLIYPIALANMMLHGIDEPKLWHGNTLTGQEIYGGLFQNVPTLYDIILTNPPFGAKEGKEAQTRFANKTGKTQVLFIQNLIDSLRPGGRCGVVIDDGVLSNTSEIAFIQTKKKLLDECDLWCIISLPADVFLTAGGRVKTDLLFFTKGEPTQKIWYYDLSDIKVTKKKPLTLQRFAEFFTRLAERSDSVRSWTVSRAEIDARNYDLKPINPHAKAEEDTRSPEELLELIDGYTKSVSEAISALRAQFEGNKLHVDAKPSMAVAHSGQD